MAEVEVGVGFSKNSNLEEAVREASIKLRSKIFSPRPELCLVFFNFYKKEIGELFFNIKRTLNPRIILGYYFPLLIVDEEIFKRGLIIITFSNLQIEGAFSLLKEDVLEDTEKFIWRLLRQVKGRKREFFLSFAVLPGFPLEFLRGLERGLGKNFPLLGVFSLREESPCFLFYNEEVLEAGVAGILFLNNLKIFSGIDSGFSPLGREGIITSFSKDTIQRIDDFPAIKFYENYFGRKVVESLEYFSRVALRYPLGFRIGSLSNYIISSPRKLNPDGSLQLFKEVLSNQIRLTMPIRERLIEATRAMVKNLKIKNPRVAFFFDSFTRYKFLKFFYTSGLKAIKSALRDVPLVGGISSYLLGLLSPQEINLGHFIGESSFSLFILEDGL